MIQLHVGRWLVLSVFALLSMTFGARADDVWRLAGTFNAWSATDDAWQMEPVTGKPGVFALERILPLGEHQFKFVRNGSWGDGHLGASEDGGLEQPGDDLVLRVRTLAQYRIELDTQRRDWSSSVVRVSEPLVQVVVRGVPEEGRTFLLDLSSSLTVLEPRRLRIDAEIVHGEAEIKRVSPSEMLFTVRTPEPGPLTIDLAVRDENETIERRVDVDVLPEMRLSMEVRESRAPMNFAAPMTAYTDGVHRSLLLVRREGVLTRLDVSRSGEVVHRLEEPRPIAPGVYVIETRNGEVTAWDEPGAVDALIPGAWSRFTYHTPAGEPAAASVHLAGEFNNWAMPGSDDAIELAPRVDGSFDILTRLPEGAYRYAFLVDGSRWVTDPANPVSVGAGENARSVATIGRTVDDFPRAEDDDILFEALRHDPSTPRDFVPISRDLGLVELSFTALPDDLEGASFIVEVKDENGQTRRINAPCRRERDLSGFDRFTARVMTNTPIVRYSFAASDGPAQYLSPDYALELPPDPLQTPEWAKGAVWYQIFAERFRNGNPLNDPHGINYYNPGWTSDWYEVSEEEIAAHAERYERGPDEPLEPRQGGPLFHVVWDRRYGGDLQGVVEKLDYLADLGVTAIYFNPVFEADSMHKYDATDFRHIDDNFGTPAEAGRVPETFEAPTDGGADPAKWKWTAADRYFLDVLLPEAKKRGIRVVIDGVWNHTGRPFWAFQDVLEKGRGSEYADWFFVRFDEEGEVESWTAWDGPSGWLPKFNQTPERDLVEPVKQHIFDVTTRWMDPNGDGDPSDGIDGWRLDVPLDIGLPFWEDWRDHVKAINPEAIIIAEIWGDARDVLRGEHFDTHMHYPFARAVTEWLAVAPGMTSDELINRLETAFDEAPQTLLIHQNLFASHDTDRYVSMLYNPGRRYDDDNRIQDDNPNDYKDTRPDERTYQLSILGVAIQATYMGAPMVYYGDELGMWGADDPTDRKPMPWPDQGVYENPDEKADFAIHAQYREWFNLRQDPEIGPVLRYGDVTHLDSGDPGVFAFDRTLNGTTVRVVVNRNDRAYSVSTLGDSGTGAPDEVDALSARYWVIDWPGLLAE
jgi:cyclomaltodextrinase / maltogenic alpha-amylase / neopullulanase